VGTEAYAAGRGAPRIAWLGTFAAPALAPAMGFFAVTAVAAVGGGYFPTSWGWAALAFLVVAGAALVVPERAGLGALDRLFLGALGGLAGWTALSILWSQSVPSSIAEVERVLVYVAGALAVLLVVGRTSAQRLIGGTLAGITGVACWALATRLFPQWLGTFDPVAGYRLSQPLGYWNGLGLLCAMGALLGVGFAARPLPRPARALAAASLPALVTTLYFTFSRGAWIALAFGLLAMLALERRRLRFLGMLGLLAPAPALAVFAASRSGALTRSDAALTTATHQGALLAGVLVLLVLVTAGAGIALAYAEQVRLARRTGRLVGLALVAAVLGAATLAVFTHGGPAAVAKKLYGGFTAKPTQVGNDLNGRIFELSSNNRVALWGTAWEDAARHPLLGSGAGTFEEFFYAHRANPALNVRDAHSLYLETLAELGPAGLALLVFALGIPVAAAFRARGETAAFGAYAAYLAHAGWDWDWELPAVTLAALLAAAGLLCAARSRARRPLRRPARAIVLAAILVLSAFAAVAALGNRAFAQAARAAAAGDWTAAMTRAEQARRLAPWAPGPLRTIGQTLLAGGDFGRAATAFRGAIARDPHNWVLWVDLAYATDGAPHRAALAEAGRLNPLSQEIPKT
jgi:hypothetical protein